MDLIQDFSTFLHQQGYSDRTVFAYGHDVETFLEQNPSADLRGVSLGSADFMHHQSPATVNRRLAALRCFLKWAAEKGLLDVVIQLPANLRSRRRGPRSLNQQEQSVLIRAAEDNNRDWSIITILLHTGIRVGELVALTERDVCLGSGQLRISTRTIPLNQQARLSFELLGRSLLIGQRGRLTSRGVQYIISKCAAVAGLCGVTASCLRATYRRNLRTAGVRVKEINSLSGHRSAAGNCSQKLATLVELSGYGDSCIERFK